MRLVNNDKNIEVIISKGIVEEVNNIPEGYCVTIVNLDMLKKNDPHVVIHKNNMYMKEYLTKDDLEELKKRYQVD
jgi:uncharacterized protein (UPF0216 family)